jgi:ABC-type multidrug transport system permease subunit
MSRHHPFLQLYFSRLREFYRQPARIFWVYGFPTVLAICLGLAFRNRPPESFEVDVVNSPVSVPVQEALESYNAKAKLQKKPGFSITLSTPEEATRRLETSKAPLVVEVGESESHPVAYRYDPTRPEAASIRAAVDAVIQESRGRTNPVPTTDITEVKPGSRYIDFLIPGLIGVNTMGGGLWGIGFLLVNFRIAKLLKCFLATPMPRRDFLLALLSARMTFLIPDLTILLLLGTIGFGMPIRGNLLLVILLDVLGGLAFAGIGLLVASRAQSTETVSGLMNLVMLPMWIFSGVFFSADRFKAIGWFVQALPLTQLLNGLRDVILEGKGLVDVAPAMAILAAWAIGSFLLALKLFRWT